VLARRSPFAGLDVCMTGHHLLENAVSNTGSGVRHPSAVSVIGEHLLEILYA